MNVQLTTTISADDLGLLKQIYETSFPVEEQRPWQSIIDNSRNSAPRLYAIIAGDQLAGLATLWILDRFAYIEHLAVAKNFRGMGVGSQAVKLILEDVEKLPVVVEIESPTASRPETVDRLKFYNRLGFVTIATDYVQPPYAPGLPSVPLHLLATTVLPAGLTTRALHTLIYGQK